MCLRVFVFIVFFQSDFELPDNLICLHNCLTSPQMDVILLPYLLATAIGTALVVAVGGLSLWFLKISADRSCYLYKKKSSFFIYIIQESNKY